MGVSELVVGKLQPPHQLRRVNHQNEAYSRRSGRGNHLGGRHVVERSENPIYELYRLFESITNVGSRARDFIQPRAGSSRLRLKRGADSISELQRADQFLEQADMKCSLR
jgi:hypothetical protein